MAKQTIAIVGGETLLGRDLREILKDQPLRGHLEVLAGVEGTGLLTEADGEPVLLAALDKSTLSDAKVIFLAADHDASRKAYELVAKIKDRPLLIDLTYSLEDEPGARLRAPLIESELPAPAANDQKTIQVIAHPAAVALAAVLLRLQAKHPIRKAVVQIFEPASERGQAGLNELQQQTVTLLSFKPLEKAVYDAQVAFNLLPRLGSESPHSIEEIEQRIDRHVATLLANRVPQPSIRLAQAAVFHGYTLSLWVELEKAATVDEVAGALASTFLDVRTGDEEHPNNVAVAGQSGVTVGAIESDRNDPKAIWLWLAADNFRLSVDNARMVAEERL